MSEFILKEAEVSGEEEDSNNLEVDINEANDYIGDKPVEDDDIHFHHRRDNRNSNNIIMSDDEYEEEEEDLYYEIPNSENAKTSRNDNKIDMSEKMKSVYGTDEYEWNHYKLPTGNVYEFLNEKHFMRRFLNSQFMAMKDNDSVNGFLPLSKNYVGLFEKNLCDFDFPEDPLHGEDDSRKIIQSKDCLFLNLLYALRYAITRESSHTNDFSCLDDDMIKELETIKPQIELDFVNVRFTDKLHLINVAIIPYGFFLKV